MVSGLTLRGGQVKGLCGANIRRNDFRYERVHRGRADRFEHARDISLARAEMPCLKCVNHSIEPSEERELFHQ
jgi:hypothetical protein